MGPGSYNGDVKFYKPHVPFIPRHGMQKLRNKVPKQGSTSIRGNYQEVESDEENSSHAGPGPGHYLTQDSTFKSRTRPNSLQLFGSGVKRFVDSGIDSGLGPG